MKKFWVFFCAIFICTIAFAHTINWHVGDQIISTTTCSSGDNITPPTAPAKYGYHVKGWTKHYTKLEYIRSGGTAYIDTGSKIKATQTVKLTMALNAIGSSGWIGCIDSTTNLLRFGVTSTALYCQRPTTDNFYITADTNFHTYIASPTMLYIDDTAVTTSVSSDMDTTFVLFGQNDGRTGTISSFLPCKISEFEITENGTPVQKLVPAKRNSDNAIGMYDMISDTFFENAGTGEFIAGPEVGAL